MNNTVGISMSSFQKIFAYDEKEVRSLFDVQVSDFPRVSVIIPTLNEAKNLRFVLPYIPDWVHEVIIVDGRSTDNTIEVALSMRTDIKIVEEQRPGKGAALRAGFDAAEGDIIVMMDADGSMNPAEIAMYVGTLTSGVDYVKGSRFLQGGGSSDLTFIRKLGNMGLNLAVKFLFGGQYTDLCYGYNAFWKRAIQVIEPDSSGFEIETLMNIRALRSKLRIAEVPSFESDRVHGDSNLKPFRDGIRVLKTILRERFSPPKNRIANHWTWTVESPSNYYNHISG